MMAKHKWRPFLDARAWAREKRLRSERQWRELYKHGGLPSDIPSSPAYVYRDQWKSWGDFLGTGYIASQNRRYRSFHEARQWARAQGIKSNAEWLRLAAEKRLPEDIPTNLRQTYRSEWQGIGDFLGSNRVATYDRKYRSFELAREWARTHGLQSETQWRKFSKQPGWLPSDIPAAAANVYKGEWTTWGDFLGTGYVANQKRRYRPFAEARAWARDQGLKSATEWNRRIRNPDWLPDDLPADPRSAYGKAFTSFGDFLGTGNLAPSQYRWMPFTEARAWAHKQQIDSLAEWRELARVAKAAKQWPRDIPTNAPLVYASEWKGWEDFLGVQRMAKRSKVEERLRHELASLLPAIDLTVRRIPIAGAGAKIVDVCAPALQLVVEFDGNFWHGTKESETRDRAKTQLLQNAGWTVVRIREHPLDLITSKDVRVPTKLSTFRRAVVVLKHLAGLGYVARDVVARYEAGGQIVSGSRASSAIRETWLPFAQAQEWVQAQGIRSQAQWFQRLEQEGWLPSDIPRYPLEVYRDQCATWGEFLGTGRLATFKRKYRTFEQAREWARAKQLKSRTHWVSHTRQEGWLPPDIPSNVYNVYKDEWTSWGDFLGTGNLAPGGHQWRPFTSARQWAQEQQLSTRAAWHVLVRNKALPPGIPVSPQTVYAEEWAGWRDFLGKFR
jgi:very-short-patch-repair endonuclease